MFRRSLNLLIVSLALAFSVPAIACAAAMPSQPCCPEQAPCGGCPQPDGQLPDGMNGGVQQCATATGPSIAVSSSTFRAELVAPASVDPPLAGAHSPLPARPPVYRLSSDPPAFSAAAATSPTWLVTKRLRL
jgi:hypothetical protein